MRGSNIRLIPDIFTAGAHSQEKAIRMVSFACVFGRIDTTGAWGTRFDKVGIAEKRCTVIWLGSLSHCTLSQVDQTTRIRLRSYNICSYEVVLPKKITDQEEKSSRKKKTRLATTENVLSLGRWIFHLRSHCKPSTPGFTCK